MVRQTRRHAIPELKPLQAWSFLSQFDPASRTGQPSLLIMVFGATAILGGFLNWRTLRSRMDRLVDDVVTELNWT
jgi:hypothetical protein